MVRNCLIAAWERHEAELYAWLQRQISCTEDAEDAFQDLFLKALLQGEGFCRISNARAWFFEVARNTVTDRLRRTRSTVLLTECLPQADEEIAAIDNLATCLPRALAELPQQDREAIQLCDLGEMTQEAFAHAKGISLPGAKSRVQRARKRLRDHLVQVCGVRFDSRGDICCFIPRTSYLHNV